MDSSWQCLFMSVWMTYWRSFRMSMTRTQPVAFSLKLEISRLNHKCTHLYVYTCQSISEIRLISWILIIRAYINIDVESTDWLAALLTCLLPLLAVSSFTYIAWPATCLYSNSVAATHDRRPGVNRSMPLYFFIPSLYRPIYTLAALCGRQIHFV